jgi:ATP-binding cassette subfamily G (WHITE) protein 2 (SNQ2)
MFASFSPSANDALRISGTLLNLFIIYTGYGIPKPQLLCRSPWVGWIYWINPFSYSFEAVLASGTHPRLSFRFSHSNTDSEFSNRNLTCAEAQVAPRDIPGLDIRNQGCGFAGAQPFSSSNPNPLSIMGERYLQVQYTYSKSHIWRNFGVVLAFTAFFIVVSTVASEYFDFSAGSGGGTLVFKRRWGKSKKALKGNILMDEEAGGVVASSGPSQTSLGEAETVQQISQFSQNEFTWRDVEYTVPLQGGGERKLLSSISGYVKPGVMVALMGASGAGKTTLLNTLAQRQTVGVMSGEMLVDGHKLGVEFQRGTGFCEQMDQHDGTQTIREALEFSALLRQEYSVPRNEKLAYVDKIINLLELNELQDAIVSSLGVEQRKRLTIGVELVAKPNLLLFLDEPTSGLDSQSAYSIVRFLKKLAQAGQAIICTLHQPSSQLIEEFDMVLALNPGGNTFYFGPFGRNGSEAVKYFGDRGYCPPSKNVAEFILETAAKGGRRPDGRKINWDEEWRNSSERQSVLHEIDRICAKHDKTEAPNSHLQREFASPVWLQTLELTRRMFKQYWRDPAYLYSKFFTAVVISFFIGFTYWGLTDSILDMQNRIFVLYLELVTIPTIIGGVLARFFVNRSLWEAREYPSRIYGWFAFCTANIVVEIPWAIFCSVISWPAW